MAIFDNMDCRYPLPKSDLIDLRGGDIDFQTTFRDNSPESCGSCGNDQFIISEDGNLILDNEIYAHTGWVEFYTYKDFKDSLDYNIQYTVEYRYLAEFFRGKIYAIKDRIKVSKRIINLNSYEYISYDELMKKKIF